MSATLQSRVSAAENEYFAEETMVTIIPNVNHPQFRFISGIFGPLESGIPCEVPLWLAITLRKRSKCIIQVPEWMQVTTLEAIVAHERSQETLSKLPFHYMEISRLIFANALEDVANPEKVALLLQDLEQIRMDRIRMGIASIAEVVKKDQSVVSTSLNNVGAMEILAMKDFFLSSVDAFLWLRPPDDQDAPAAAGASGRGGDAAGAPGPSSAPRKLRKFRDT